jgi:hypothetical protein
MNTSKTCKNSLALFLILVSLVFPVESTLARITKSPFLLRVYRNQAAIMWEIDTAGSGKLLYGTNVKEKPNRVVTSPQCVQYEIRQDPTTL